jgi:hypothetical protein
MIMAKKRLSLSDSLCSITRSVGTPWPGNRYREDGFSMVYVNRNVQWSQYNRIMLEPVEFYDSANSTLSQIDQHMLTTYFYNQPKADLEKSFTLVDQGGPGVIVLQVAMVSASAATLGLRSMSVVIPRLRVINAAQGLATGSCAFVGSAEAAMKATDAVSWQLLAGEIDKRAGGIFSAQRHNGNAAMPKM